MKKIPTDLQILEEIYRRYYSVFSSFSSDNPNRQTKVYVPIDISVIANHFGVDGDIVHGRLYHHLDGKHRINRADGTTVPFFRFVEGVAPSVRHQVQFPMLAAVAAGLREARDQYLWATRLSIASFVISIVAVVVSLR